GDLRLPRRDHLGTPAAGAVRAARPARDRSTRPAGSGAAGCGSGHPGRPGNRSYQGSSDHIGAALVVRRGRGRAPPPGGVDDPPGGFGPVDPAHRPGLDRRRAALRADPQTRLDRRFAGRARRGGLVKFSAPGWFALIAVVVALAVGYALAQVRRRKHTLRFANFDMLEKVAPRRPSALRHLPTVIVLVGLMLLVVA